MYRIFGPSQAENSDSTPVGINKTSTARKAFHALRQTLGHFLPILLAILVGLGIGGLAFEAINTSNKWALVIVAAVVAVPITVLVNDIKKLILITLTVDLALGIDIAIQNQGWHRGGPTGYLISLMTIAIIVGYTFWIIERSPKPRFVPLVTIPALLYLIMSVVSFYQASNLQLSLFGFLLKVQVFLVYFYLINQVKTWADIHIIVTTVGICLLLESTVMVLQYVTGANLDIGGLVTSHAINENGGDGVTGSRVSGTLATPGNAAVYLNSMMMLIFGAYLTKLTDKRLALVALGMSVIALIGTSSRAGWSGFVVGALILMTQAVRTEIGRKSLPFILVGVVLVGTIFGQTIQERIVTVTEDESRAELAYMARNIIRAFPLGVGDNNYDQVMSDKYAHPDWVGHTHRPPHNKYLVVWTEMGPQGLTAFILFLAVPVLQTIWLLLKNRTSPRTSIMAFSLLAGLTTYFIHMRSESFSGRAQVQLLWFLIAILVIVNQLILQSEPHTVLKFDPKQDRLSLPINSKSYEAK